MKFSVILSAVALLGASALANPMAEPEDVSTANPDGDLRYHIVCRGGQRPDRRCTNGQRRNGCRCDGRGTYLCNPSSLHKRGGACAKCGCARS